MSAPPSMIPDDVRRFVLTSVPSVPYLEAMLLFQKEPSTTRTAAEVAARLYIKESAAHALLEALSAFAVIAATEGEPGRFAYAPKDAALMALIDRIAAAYASNLIEITNLIHDRTQRSAVQFADAFKLRKD